MRRDASLPPRLIRGLGAEWSPNSSRRCKFPFALAPTTLHTPDDEGANEGGERAHFSTREEDHPEQRNLGRRVQTWQWSQGRDLIGDA